MKSITKVIDKSIDYTLWAFLIVNGLFLSLKAYAQDNGVDDDLDVNITIEERQDTWYTAWWVWLIGIALFIIIIVAIVSAGRRREP